MTDPAGQSLELVRGVRDEIRERVLAARTMPDTFAGIEQRSAPPFVLAQIAAVPLAVVLIRIIYPHVTNTDERSVPPPSNR